ncbi:MAG: kdpD [Acidimicrobiales bacterium]|nr:kdpD [Acidimicrobiales bacterium]
MLWRHSLTPGSSVTPRRRALGLTALAVALAGGAAGLGLGLLASPGQPLALAALLAGLGGCEYAFLAWREGRRAAAAEARQRLREDLVATVSHELRSPLAPIRGWASTLLEHGDRLDAEERRQALESIVRQARRLERLLVSLLEASKVDSGRVASEGEGEVEVEVDLAAVVERVVDEFAAAWPARPVRVGGERGPCLVVGRELLIEQILANLLSNAVKYAPDGQPIEVSVDAGPEEVELAVSDHGPGIPPGETDRIFERFERLQCDERGTGLGLYIARRMAGEIGARLSVEATPDGGARFALALRRVPVLVAH